MPKTTARGKSSASERVETVSSRYDRAKITAEIEHHRERLGWSVRALALVARFGKTGESARWPYYKARTHHSWSIEQVGRVAEALGAPDFWPFREWTVELRAQYPGTLPPNL